MECEGRWVGGLDLSLANLTAGSLLGVVVLLVLTGRLVPWWIPKDRYEDYEQRIKTLETTVDFYRDTNQKLNDATLMQAQAQVEQLEVARRNDRFIDALQFQASRKGQLNAIPEPAEEEADGDDDG